MTVIPKRLRFFVLMLLIVEFLDEWTFGVREAALPFIHDDLHLSYVQIGLFSTIPNLVSTGIEPVLGIWGDLGKRRVLVLGGGIFFALALLLLVVSQNFLIALLAFVILFPASGAFVSLSQATLMDTDPTRHQQNMARWTLAGSMGVVLGPLSLGVGIALGLGWRGTFLVVVGATALLVAYLLRFDASYFPSTPHAEEGEAIGFWGGVRRALTAVRRKEVVRWLVLLQFSDFMLDILFGYIALYFVDVVGVSNVQAGFAVAVWTIVGLAGDFLLIPLLERVDGLYYLRWSVAIKLVLFPLFLLIGGFIPKLVILGLLGFLNAGWYSILKGQLYTSMAWQSGSVMAVDTVVGVVATLIPVTLDAIADTFGLATMMWCLLIGPIALIVGLPRGKHPRNIPP